MQRADPHLCDRAEYASQHFGPGQCENEIARVTGRGGLVQRDTQACLAVINPHDLPGTEVAIHKTDLQSGAQFCLQDTTYRDPRASRSASSVGMWNNLP